MRRSWSWFLACVLLAAHTLGAIHGVAHARAVPGTVVQTQAAAAAPIGGLFKHDDGGGCRLFDQLSHGDAAPATAFDLAPMPAAPAACVPAVREAAAAPISSPARGPPVLA